MRRFYALAACVILTALSALLFVEKSSAQNSDEVQKYIQQWLDTYQPQIEQVQADYFKTHGSYWQGVATHSDAVKPQYTEADKNQPIDSRTSFTETADCLSCKPSDQLQQPTWQELFPDVVTKLPADLAIDVYDGPQGMGYVIRLEYCVESICYRKIASVGPEQSRSSAWEELESESVIK